MNNFGNFHTVENLKFDVKKLQKALKQVLKIKNYDSANGIKNFAAICLNQIPGKPESTRGNYARGVYWTKPDHDGKEAVSFLRTVKESLENPQRLFLDL